MGDNPPSDTKTSTRTAVWRFTLATPPLLWCFGFLFSLFMGCSAWEALLKATAYTLSGFGGWVVYLLIRRPSVFPFGVAILIGMNAQMLNPTRTPWPFHKMLAHGLFVSVLVMSILGLVGRLLGSGKNARRHGVHPLSDAEVDQPVPGR